MYTNVLKDVMNVDESLETDVNAEEVLKTGITDPIQDASVFNHLFTKLCEYVFSTDADLPPEEKENFIKIFKLHIPVHGKFMEMCIVVHQSRREEQRRVALFEEVCEQMNFMVWDPKTIPSENTSKKKAVPSRKDKWDKPWY